ncbi:MAG: protein kinase [Polyangiales bacterium]
MNQTDRLAPGTILGAYEIISFIAAGGMGSVYRARNRILGDLRAVKVILPSLSSNPEFVQRFVREAQLAARISHPNVVKMLEPAMDGQTMFLPMELLEGESLQDLAKRETPLHPTVAIDLIIPVCAGLQAIHDAGIIHRDVKPANVFLAKDPQGNVVPKLIDLGAARDIDAGEQTSTGAVIGSAHYMPIEQAAGRKDIDLRVDVYALGVMLYLLLTRKRPYENDETGVAMAKVLQGAAFAMPREISPWLPVELEQVVLQTLARDREQRPPSAMAVAELLTAIRPLCEGVKMPQQIRERHMTGSASISKVSGIAAHSGVSGLNSIKSKGLPGAEPSQASMVQGVATQIPEKPKSKAVPVLIGVGVLALVLGGVGIAMAMKSGNANANSEGNAARDRGAATSAVADAGAPSNAAANGPSEAVAADSGIAAQEVSEDAGVAVAQSNEPHDSGVATQPRVNPRQNAARNSNTGTGGSARTAPRGGCVPRPGVPCL